MANCGNGTQTGDGCHFFCGTFSVAFWVITTMLAISLFWNIFCCVSKCCLGKGTCQPRKRQRQSPRQMEENPIYGNISYMQTTQILFTEVDPQQSPPSSSSPRDQHTVSPNPQSKDCYANLTLKPPKLQSGRSSPQIQYSDVVHLEEPSVMSEKEDEGNTDAISTMSDLYASVQTQRTKTLDTADNGEDYANHL